MIYLDYTAHMPSCEAALNAFTRVEEACVGNANARHSAGSAAKALLEEARSNTAQLLSVGNEEIIFTSGASESNNTAIRGLAYALRHFGKHIITSPLEHPSVSGCLTALQERGYEIDVLPLCADGHVDLEALKRRLRTDTVLVTLCAVDSELGVIQPINEVSQILKAYPNCRLHVDATQAIGKIPLNLSLADTASISAHKFGGITGSGVLYKKKEIDMEPLIYGGVNTSLYRSGSPAVSLNSALAAALGDALTRFDERADKVASLNQYLRSELKQRGIRVYSPSGAINHILNVGLDGIKGYEMRNALNDRGVCVSVKSACAVENTPSRAVYALSGSRRQALESWRISLSHQTTFGELNEFLNILDAAMEDLKKR